MKNLNEGKWILIFLSCLSLTAWAIVFFGADGNPRSSILILAMAVLFAVGYIFTIYRARKSG